MKWSESATMAVEPYLSLVATIFQSTQLSGSIPQPPSHILRRLRIIRFVRWRNIACKWRNTMLYSYISILSQFFADWCDIWDKTCRFVQVLGNFFQLHPWWPHTANHARSQGDGLGQSLGVGIWFWGFGMGVCPVSSLFPTFSNVYSSPFFGMFWSFAQHAEGFSPTPNGPYLLDSPYPWWINQWESRKKSPTLWAVLCSTSHHENEWFSLAWWIRLEVILWVIIVSNQLSG